MHAQGKHVALRDVIAPNVKIDVTLSFLREAGQAGKPIRPRVVRCPRSPMQMLCYVVRPTEKSVFVC